MKKLSILFLSLFLGVFLLSSCGGGGEKSKTTENEGSMSESDTMTKMEEQTPEPQAEESEEMDMEGKNVKDLTQSGEMAEVTIETPGGNMQEMHYTVDVLKINAGQKITLHLNNTGTDPSMKHNAVIIVAGKGQEVAMAGLKEPNNDYIPADNEAVLAHTKLLDPGQKDTIEFSIDQPGKYKFICTYPGHFPTMQGDIIVN